MPGVGCGLLDYGGNHMEWWQLWDRVSLSAQPLSSRGDYEVTWWVALVGLATLAAGLFALAKVTLDRR